MTGTVVDESKAVLPGATVTASDLETGRKYAAVSDERGEYRLRAAARHVPGAGRALRLRHRRGAEGRAARRPERDDPFTLKVASLAETLTVTGETPLVDISSTQVAGNVDRRQMEELPLQGRNWMELSMLVKGITANDVDQHARRRRRTSRSS